MAVKVRSAEEIKALDEELNLFDDSEWVFMDVLNTQVKNAEYFNDVRDDDFLKSKNAFLSSNFVAVAAMLAMLLVCGMFLVSYSNRDTSDFDKLKDLGSVVENKSIAKVEGNSVTSDKLVGVDKVLTDYFRCVTAESDYNNLYDYCSSTSAFADAYYNATDKVVSLFDDTDCYARMLRKLSSFCTIGKISTVVEKDGIYYCYVEMGYPNSIDIQEYLNLYSYNMTKYFSSHDLTEQEFVRFMVDTTASSPMRCHTEEYCIRLKEKNGEFKLVNDTFMIDICDDAYQTFVSQMSNMLSGNTALE